MNPLISAIQWDVNNSSLSAAQLVQSLTALQTEWATKLGRTVQITSTDIPTAQDFAQREADLYGDSRETVQDLYVAFNPQIPEVHRIMRNVEGVLMDMSPITAAGKSQTFAIGQTAPINGDPSDATLFSLLFKLRRPAILEGYHPIYVDADSGGIAGTYRATISHATGTATSPPSQAFWSAAAGYHFIRWHALAPTPAGDIAVSVTISRDAIPMFPYYAAASAASMPTGYVQPPVSYLKVTYL